MKLLYFVVELLFCVFIKLLIFMSLNSNLMKIALTVNVEQGTYTINNAFDS